jgi:hypothetical protein
MPKEPRGFNHSARLSVAVKPNDLLRGGCLEQAEVRPLALQPDALPSHGHGRNGAYAFRGAREIEIAHPYSRHGNN